MLVATNVRSEFWPLLNGRVVYLDGRDNLYYYDGKNSTLIDKSVVSFYHTEDTSRLVYKKKTSKDEESDNTYSLIGVYLKNTDEKTVFTRDCDNVVLAQDLDNIYYEVYDSDSNILYLAGFDREKERLGTNLTNVVSVPDETLTVYYAKSKKSKKHVGSDEIQENEYQSDTVMLELENWLNDTQTIYACKNGTSTEIADNVLIVGGTFDGAIGCVDAESLITDNQLKGLWNLEEDEIREEIKELLRSALYVIVEKTGEKIQLTDEVADYLIDSEGEQSISQIYVNSKEIFIENEDGSLFVAEIQDGKASTYTTLSDMAWVIQNFDTEVYYVNDYYATANASYGNLCVYKDGKEECLARDICWYGSCIYEDGTIITYTDYSDDDGGTLVQIGDDGKQKKIADYVTDYVRCDASTILYIADGDLWLCRNKKDNKKISVGVDFFKCNETMPVKKNFTMYSGI